MFDGRLVRLRAAEERDVETFHRWMNDPAVTEGLARRYPFSLAHQREWITTNAAPSYGSAHYAIETLDEGRLVGACGFHEASPENRSGEIGISIGDRDSWGRGYGTDATRTLCRIGFEEMNLHRVQLWVHHTNARAIGVYERLGFVHEGRARQAWWKHGEWRDMVLMGLLRGELRPDPA